MTDQSAEESVAAPREASSTTPGVEPEPRPMGVPSAAYVELPPPQSEVAVRISRAEALVAGGDSASAVEHYTAALQADPGSVSALLGLGSVYLRRAQYDVAEKEFRKALRLAPNVADVHHQLGLTYYRRGLYGGALQHLRRAVELDGEHTASYILMGEALNQIGETDAAIEALETAARHPAAHSKAFYALGIAYDRKGLPDRAAEMYRRSREVGAR